MLAGMSPNAEMVRAIYAALAEGDVGPLVERLHEDVEWYEPEGAPVVSGRYAGRSAVLSEVLLRATDVWAEFRIVPDEFLVAGDSVVVTGELSVTGRGTGGRAAVPFAHIWDLRDGLIVRWRCFTDTALLNHARTSR